MSQPDIFNNTNKEFIKSQEAIKIFFLKSVKIIAHFVSLAGQLLYLASCRI